MARGMLRVPGGVNMMRMRQVRVMRGLLVIARLGVLRGL